MDTTGKLVTKDKKRLSYLTFVASVFICGSLFPTVLEWMDYKAGNGEISCKR